MTDLDRVTLERVLPATPGSPDWVDVSTRVRARRSRRRRRVAALVAAATVVAIGTASAFGTVRNFFFSEDPSVVSIVCNGTLVDDSARKTPGRRIVARGRFVLRIAFTGGISDRGRFVDYGWGPSDGRYARVLLGRKGTIEITFPVGAPDWDWRVTKGTGAYAGLRGGGGEAGRYGPRTVAVEMAGEFRQ